MEDILVRIRTGLASNNPDDVSKAFRRCFRAFHARMLFLAIKILKDNQLAQDAVQEAFAALWLQPQKLTGVENLGAYFNGTVKNVCLKILKIRARQEDTAAQYQRGTGPPVEDPFGPPDSRESYERLAILLERLPEFKRNMMYLRFKDELPLAEIAEKLGMTEDAVAKQVYRIRKDLKVKMNFK